MVNLKAVAVVAVAVLMAACAANRTAPIRNVSDSPVVGVSGQTLTLPDIERAIRRAGAQLGWTMKTVNPGLIEATLVLRTHSATVDIPFSQKSYSIQYKTSTNLQADGNVIHQNYNGWIDNLDKGIRVQLVN
jgi:hypothetical protein